MFDDNASAEIEVTKPLRARVLRVLRVIPEENTDTEDDGIPPTENSEDTLLTNPSVAPVAPPTVAGASHRPDFQVLQGTHYTPSLSGDPTADAAEALIGLQDSHTPIESSITDTALTLDEPNLPDLSEDTDSPAATDDDTRYDSTGECYIACSQVSSKRLYVLLPLHRRTTRRIQDASLILPTAFCLSGIHQDPVSSPTRPPEIENSMQRDTPDHHVALSVTMMDSLSLKPVFDVACEQPPSRCHSMQTRKRNRTAIEPTDQVTDMSASGPVDMGDNFVEKFFMALTPFQVIHGTGNITEMTVHSIVNPNTPHLDCAIGISGEIADAWVTDFAQECRSHIRTYTTLPVTAVTHSSAGDMRSHIQLVVQIVWPALNDYPDSDTLQHVLVSALVKTLRYTNDVLRATTLAIPVVGVGIFNVPPLVILSAIYQTSFTSSVIHMRTPVLSATVCLDYSKRMTTPHHHHL